ncbi:MAG TPA: uroporphyrinogen decarboxylase family protein [Blastocatellia bacterium]|nr:uroporphyrinogen decarboxylase family protein [Blastocatellia bacterium]
MNKIERVKAALSKDEVDRPPFSFWYHFGLQHMPGRTHAEAEIDFYRAYDLDFVKVMNDYPYPLPAGLESLETEDDWKRIEPITGDAPCWNEQLKALSLINSAIGKEALFIDTIFSPWTTARRLARHGGLDDARARFPQTVLSAMDAIATSLSNYARAVVTTGAAGIFLSLGAATSDVLTQEEYNTWCRPFDLKVLNAVRDSIFNVLHIHGRNIYFDLVVDYPATALNWSHFLTPPTLKEGWIRSNRAVLGGIDETAASHFSPRQISDQIHSSIAEMGSNGAAEEESPGTGRKHPAPRESATPVKELKGLIIAPGCSISTDTPERNMRAVKSVLESLQTPLG